MIYTLTINREPFGKQEKRIVRRGKFTHSYFPKETTEYMTQIGKEFKNKYPSHKLISGPVKLTLTTYRTPPTTMNKTYVNNTIKKDMLDNKIRPCLKPDSSNISKLVEDGLTGAAWIDDCQIVESHIYKYFSTEPRIEIEIENI